MMKRPRISIAALAAICVAVCLTEGPARVRAAAAGPDRPYHVIDSAGRVQLVVRNANDCAPWLAEAVWGPGPPTAAPLGYRCFYNPNGGRR
ncbi:MAG: hypothetical protein ABSC22_13930 [Roseiarcus sp.]